MDTSILRAQTGLMNDNIRLAKEQGNQPATSQLRAQATEEYASQDNNKSILERDKERQAAQQDKVTLSEEGMQRLRGEKAKTEKEEKDDNLPPHIKALKKQAEKLKEKLEEKELEIEELKRQSVPPEVLEMHMKQLKMMQTQLAELKTTLSEALKEAGISDLSIIADI